MFKFEEAAERDQFEFFREWYHSAIHELVGRADFQRNSRAGITIAFPFARRHALRAGYSVGLTTGAGSDFRTLLLTYAFRI